MNDFSTQLTAMFDDVAAGITPRPNFDAARAGAVPVVANGAVAAHRFRRPAVAAAAALLLVSGGVAAFQVARDDSASLSADRRVDLSGIEITDTPSRPAPAQSGDAEQPAPLPGAVPAVGPEASSVKDDVDATPVGATAQLGETVAVGDTLTQKIYGHATTGTAIVAESDHGQPSFALASNGEWKLVMDLVGLAPSETARIEVAVGDDATFTFEVQRPAEEPKPEVKEEVADEPKEEPAPVVKEEPAPVVKEEPKPEPEPEPEPVVFTSHTVDPYNDETYLKRSFYGTAPAGAKVVAASEWGALDTVADHKGNWEMRLILTGVPHGTVVRVEVSASTGGSAVYELVRESPAPPPEPKVVEFTSNLGDIYDTADYFKPVLFGTGTPGSVVVASSQFGTADAKVNGDGHWELWYKLFDVPPGAWVNIQVTNNQSEAAFSYEVRRPEAEEPAVIEFTARAAFVECDSTPPFNEYWGTAQPGATITISSPYGGGQATANDAGKWEARVEFPDAPLGETFNVLLTNSKSETAYEKPFKRIDPT